MSVYLDVPFVSQLDFGGGMNDPTGCWYASACMVAYHFEAGPRLGVPEIYGPGGHAATGSNQARARLIAAGVVTEDDPWGKEHELLAQREGLEPLPKCSDRAHNYSLGTLEAQLRGHGPIFFYWQKTHGESVYGHASVLIGTVDAGSKIIYHDPENAPNSRMSLSDFNAKRQRWKYALMRRKGVVSNTVRIKR